MERFVWRPDYLPFSGKGLPQISLDTPRLVAHAFLFEIDRLLEETTNGDFVRWMDDINFGCDDEKAAKQILGKTDDLLLSRGIHLNPSKTEILNSQQAYEYFQLKENRYLTIFQNRLKRLIAKYRDVNHPQLRVMRKLLHRRYRNFIAKDKYGHWDKVLKRYFNLASMLEDPFLEDDINKYLSSNVSVRSSIFRYLIAIGWSESRENLIVQYLTDASDDESFFGAIDVLIHWIPEPIVKYCLRMRKLAKVLAENNNVANFIGGLWLVAKYGNDDDILNFTSKTINVWKSNEWLARQVAALWPRISSQKTKDNIRNVINVFGLAAARLVLDNYGVISTDETTFSLKVLPYISATMGNDYYTVPKFLIALSVFQGSLSNQAKATAKQQLLKVLKDPIYIYHIRKVSW